MWHHNNLINPDDVEWEIGMGLPLFSLSLGGYFRSIVATETNIDWYCNVINYFEALGKFVNSNKSFRPGHNLVVKTTHSNEFYEKPSNAVGCKNKLPPRKVVAKKKKSTNEDNNLSDSEDHAQDDTSEEYSYEESTDDSSSSDYSMEDDEPI